MKDSTKQLILPVISLAVSIVSLTGTIYFNYKTNELYETYKNSYNNHYNAYIEQLRPFTYRCYNEETGEEIECDFKGDESNE